MSSLTTTVTSEMSTSSSSAMQDNINEKKHSAQHITTMKRIPPTTLKTPATKTTSKGKGAGDAMSQTRTPFTPFTPKSPQEYNSPISMEWAQLPRMPASPPREEFQPVEKFVTDAVLSRHFQPKNEEEQANHRTSPASVGYRAILDLFQKKDDLQMLKKVFLALRTNGVERICSERSKHNRLIHYIFRLNPFDPKEKGAKHYLSAMNNIIYNHNNGKDSQARPGSSAAAAAAIEDYTLGEVYLNFIVALTSANSVFLTPTLNALWRLITSTDAVTPHDLELYLSSPFLPSVDENNNKKTNTTTALELKQRFLQRQLKINSLLHGSLRKVLHLVPKGNSEIFPVIASSFPFKLAPLPTQVNYIKQSLIVLRYVPSMQRQFLELCVDKCLEIDVEIQIADNGKVKIEEKKSEGDEDDYNENKHVNDELVANLFQAQSENEPKPDAEIARKEQSEEEKVDEMAEKLDTLMYLVFEHLQLVTSSKQKSPSSLFKMLLPSFESVILTTHRCKFIQFLIVFLCGLDSAEDGNLHARVTDIPGHDAIVEGTHDPANDEIEQPRLFREFAAKLIDIVLDPYRATVTRQSAVCYLASFVSRTACVNAETACEAVSALLRFAEAYMDAYPTEASARNAGRYLGAESNGEQAGRLSIHSLFYTISQASFYIMCFRGKDCIQYYRRAEEYHQNLEDDYDPELLDYSDPQLIDITAKRWNRLCSHHLNPLRFCLESVRGEFLLLADNFDLLDQDLLNKLMIEDRKMESSAMLTVASPSPSSSLRSGVKRMVRKRRKVSLIQTPATLKKRRLVGGVGGLGKGSNPLDSFFPFDPYLLRRSYVFVDPHYRHWNANSCMVDSSDDSTNGTNEGEVVTKVEESEVKANNDEDDDVSSDSDSEDDDDDSEEEEEEEEEKDGGDLKGTAMSLTSATMSMGGSEWTDDDSDSDMDTEHHNIPVQDKTWVNELKRARTLSAENCCW